MRFEASLRAELEKKIEEKKLPKSFATGFRMIGSVEDIKTAALTLVGDDETRIKDVVNFAEKVFKLALSTAVATALFSAAKK